MAGIIPAESQESLLRAMATNYAGGHRWDHLDGKAVTAAADEIKALRKAIEILKGDSEFPFSGKLRTFLYLLARDHLPIGAIETLVERVNGHEAATVYSNEHLGAWAAEKTVELEQ